MSSILSVSGLGKGYPDFQLDNVSFQLEQGRIMGFIGRNGAGKTTTLKSLLNFIHPDCGSITFFGKSLEGHEPEIKQELGYVSGGVDYYPRAKLKSITRVVSRLYDRWDSDEYILVMEGCAFAVPFFRDKLDTMNSQFMGEKLTVPGTGIAVYIILVLLSLSRCKKSFEGLNI